MPARLVALSAALALLLAAPAAAADDALLPEEPAGYRLDDYRTPVPATVAGRPALDTAAAQALWRAGDAVFIDVLPAPQRPEGLAAGALWAPRPRLGIPGSIWLPDVGRGALSPELEAWFRANLAELSGRDAAARLVFYCLADCWMSWNAAKRALAWGYANALWYRDGTDGWTQAGLPLEKLTPRAPPR